MTNLQHPNDIKRPESHAHTANAKSKGLHYQRQRQSNQKMHAITSNLCSSTKHHTQRMAKSSTQTNQFVSTGVVVVLVISGKRLHKLKACFATNNTHPGKSQSTTTSRCKEHKSASNNQHMQTQHTQQSADKSVLQSRKSGSRFRHEVWRYVHGTPPAAASTAIAAACAFLRHFRAGMMTTGRFEW